MSKIEARLRRHASRLGLAVRKSRAREIHADDLGGYRLVDVSRNAVIAGSRFELDLEDVAEELAAIA